jgi:hypothetical protein
MTTHQITAYFHFCGDRMAVDIAYTYKRGRPAVMYLRNGDPGYPAEDAEVEVVRADPEEGVTLPDIWQKRLTEWAYEWLIGEGYHEACARAEDNIEWDRERTRR